MDIARLLTYDNDDPHKQDSVSDADTGPHEISPLSSTSSPTASLSAGSRRVPRDRRRQAQVQKLRAQVQAYEYVLANLPIVLSNLEDEPASTANDTDEMVDTDTERMRAFLHRTSILAHESEQELAKRAEWLRLLRQRQLSTMGLRQLMTGLVVDDWHWMCERWRALACEHYKPFSETRCAELVQETLQAIDSYDAPMNMKESGYSLFGWRDSHFLDGDRRYVHFHIHKTLQRADIEALVEQTWSVYQQGRFQEFNIDANCQFFSQILQRVSPDILIIQIVERYSALLKMTYTLSIAFRVKTATGYLISLRSIRSSELQRLMQSEGLSLSGNFYWNTFDSDSRDSTAVHTIIAGYIGSEHHAYAKRWGNEIILSVVRAEAKLMGKPVVVLPPSE